MRRAFWRPPRPAARRGLARLALSAERSAPSRVARVPRAGAGLASGPASRSSRGRTARLLTISSSATAGVVCARDHELSLLQAVLRVGAHLLHAQLVELGHLLGDRLRRADLLALGGRIRRAASARRGCRARARGRGSRWASSRRTSASGARDWAMCCSTRIEALLAQVFFCESPAGWPAASCAGSATFAASSRLCSGAWTRAGLTPAARTRRGSGRCSSPHRWSPRKRSCSSRGGVGDSRGRDQGRPWVPARGSGPVGCAGGMTMLALSRISSLRFEM